jgi:hypothetical protein
MTTKNHRKYLLSGSGYVEKRGELGPTTFIKINFKYGREALVSSLLLPLSCVIFIIPIVKGIFKQHFLNL